MFKSKKTRVETEKKREREVKEKIVQIQENKG